MGGVVYARHRLDASLVDVLFGLAACVVVWRRGRSLARVLRACRAGEDGLVCLSVRTGWDLWLGASGLREGDEVLASAVTHPEMARVARLRGIRVVPVDIDPETLAPRTGALQAALTPRTRAVLVAHLFGGRLDPAPISRFCEEHGLLLVEDCAQSFAGPGEMGHPDADLSMYSFGTLKTSTAFGGAVLRVRDRAVLDRMRAIEAGYPVQSRRAYAARLINAILLMGVSRPRAYGILVRACARFGVDLDGLVDLATKSHPAGVPDGELLGRIRRRPSAPVISLLRRRLERFDTGRLAARAAAGERLSGALRPSVARPGAGSQERTYWIFPIVVRDPDELVDGLRHRGFDASRATSSIVALRPPEGRPEPSEAAGMMAGIVFLPAPIGLPETELQRLASAVNELATPQRGSARLLA